MAIRTVFGNREGRERKSLANREYYKTLIEGKKDASFLADADGDLFLLNKDAQLLTGYSEEDIKELHARDIFITIRNIENPFDSKQYSEFSSRFYLLDARRFLIPVIVDFKEIEAQKFLCTCVGIEEKKIAAATDEVAGVLLESPPLNAWIPGLNEVLSCPALTPTDWCF